MTINVKIPDKKKLKVTILSETFVTQTLDKLPDVNVTGKSDKYVLMYNNSNEKWIAVNPDDVLSAASDTEITQPGLPTDFVDTLDADLDDKIDLDGGTW